MDNDLNTPEQANYKGWYVTRIESAVRKNDANTTAMHFVDITYADPADSARRFCPQSIVDEFGRSVTFDCQATTAGGAAVDGGVVRSIAVPAPHGATLIYQLNTSVHSICDPLNYTPSSCPGKDGILLLDGIQAVGVSPPHIFSFDYSRVPIDNPAPDGPLFYFFGDLRTETLPGGAKRSYSYDTYRVWQKDYPIVYVNRAVQFSYFPVRAVTSKSLEIDGKTWKWDYERMNDPLCSEALPAMCYSHPSQCTVTGPYDPDDSTIAPSTTVYAYKATRASVGTPDRLDGTTTSIEIYAGTPDASRLLRTTSFEYAYDLPQAGNCNNSGFYRGHYADNVRVSTATTSIDDDGKPTPDKRVVKNEGWVYFGPSHSFGRFQLRKEYKADGTSLYRVTESSFPFTATAVQPDPLTQTQFDNWVLTPMNWIRVLEGESGTSDPIAQTDYLYDAFGRLDSVRGHIDPAPDPTWQNPYDIVTSYTYDAGNGNVSTVETKVALDAGGFVEKVEAWQMGLPTKRRMDGTSLATWYTLDVDRDFNTGLPTQVRNPWKTGVSIHYDLLGRPIEILPLPLSPDPSITLTYSPSEILAVIGNPAASSSIQQKTIADGLGRVKEERVLKYDDAGNDQWVSRISKRDVFGNIASISEWAPVGASNVPATSFERFGIFPGLTSGFDPLSRVRRTIRPDGSVMTTEFQGLTSTSVVSNIRSGPIGLVPSSISSKMKQIADIFGRVIETESFQVSGATEQFIVGAVNDYDYMDHLSRSRTKTSLSPLSLEQPRTWKYDPLGRLIWTEEPERGRVFYSNCVVVGGSVYCGGAGLNANGQSLRFQDEAGYAASPRYHYLTTYDPAGRPVKLEQEFETSPASAKKKIAEYFYDLPSAGNGNGSELGRQGRIIAYDGSEMVVSKTDYFYTEALGRLDHFSTVFDAWDGEMSNLGGAGSSDATLNTFYTYDDLNQVQSMTYPTSSGGGGGSSSTYLSFARTHGLLRNIDSNRGSMIVYNALYGYGLGLKEWGGSSGLRTQITTDDPMGTRIREIKVRNSLGSTLWTTGTYTYDGAGNIATIGQDDFRYDALGRLTGSQVFDASGANFRAESFAYDSFGNIQSKTSAFNYEPANTTTYNFDTARNRIRGLGVATNWAYRPEGALANDDSLNYAYDNAGRLMQVLQGATEVGRYFYDATGLRVHRQENHGRTVFSFRDPDGNVLSQFSRPSGTMLLPQWDRDFVYLAGNRVSMIEKPAPARVSWMLTRSVNNGPNPGISLEWYPNPETSLYGYLVERKGPGQTNFMPIYDATNVRTATGTTYLDTAVVEDSTYTYRILAMDVNGTQGDYSAEKVITFDDGVAPPVPLNVLAEAGETNVVLTWTEDSPPADLAGFYIKRKVGSGGSFSTLNSYPITSLFYNDVAVTSGTIYTYKVVAADNADLQSADSAQVSATPGSGGGGGPGGSGGGGNKPVQTWNDQDVEDEGGVRFSGSRAAVGLAGERSQSVNPVNVGGRSDSNEDSEDTGGMTASPYAMVGQSVGARILWLHSDHLGSLRLVTNIGGQVVTNHKYLPFGEDIQPMHSLDPFKYAGYERDSESGMDYVRARFYTPGRGRWLTPDPLGDGYVYTSNSPTNRLDPTGLEDILVCPSGSCSTVPAGAPPGWPWDFGAFDFAGVGSNPDSDPNRDPNSPWNRQGQHDFEAMVRDIQFHNLDWGPGWREREIWNRAERGMAEMTIGLPVIYGTTIAAAVAGPAVVGAVVKVASDPGVQTSIIKVGDFVMNYQAGYGAGKQLNGYTGPITDSPFGIWGFYTGRTVAVVDTYGRPILKMLSGYY